MRERTQKSRARVHKYPGSCVFGRVFFRTALPCYCGYHPQRGGIPGMPLRDAVGINC